MSLVTAVSELAAPWAHLYNDSKLVSTSVTFLHLGGVLLGGGFAIASDRATLRLPRTSPGAERVHLDELHSIHRPVLIGLTLTFLSGLLQFGADVETFLPAPFFWIKMTAIALLLGNGAVLQRAETELRRGTPAPERAWRRLRQSAWASLGLWFGTLLLGTALLAI
jgi:hypothetical protein